MHYDPKDLDKESDEFTEALKFLAGADVAFDEEQTDVFYKTMYNLMTNRDLFNNVTIPGQGSEGSVVGEGEGGGGAAGSGS